MGTARVRPFSSIATKTKVPSVTLLCEAAPPVLPVTRDHTSICTWIELRPTDITLSLIHISEPTRPY